MTRSLISGWKISENEQWPNSFLREAFKIFDRDKDGYVDMKEFKTVGMLEETTIETHLGVCDAGGHHEL